MGATRRHGNSGFVAIPRRQMEEIGRMKRKSIALANEVAHKHGVPARMYMM
jgi:antitoxin component of MazEF toxin-antitoxin module